MTDGTAPFSALRIKNANDTRKAFERLSSGKRINSAADDPAGLAIVSKLQFSIDTLGQVSRNIKDTTSQIDITDSALEQVDQISGRLSELAAQAANGTYSAEQRAAIQNEYSELTKEITRIGESTEFNGRKLLDGTAITAQVGTDSSPSSQITTPAINLSTLVSGIASQTLGSQSGAQAALDQVKSFRDQIATARGNLGSVSNRLVAANDVADVTRENLSASQSRIRDVDVAQETARLIGGQIRQKADTALQAVGNLNRATVLSLLGGRR